MNMGTAKQYVGMSVELIGQTRTGQQLNGAVSVFGVGSLTLLEPFLITDKGDIPLDRIVAYNIPDTAK